MLDDDIRIPEPAAPINDQERATPVLQKNWQDLIKPTKLNVTPGRDPARFATVIAEPLERGFGLTLGNALRRVLLSSLQGAAITSVHIDGVLHEFSSIPGVREDVTNIVLNIKEIAVNQHSEGVKRMVLQKEGPGVATAGDIQGGSEVESLNPDHVICTLDEGAAIHMEFTSSSGKGYVPAERNRPDDAPIGPPKGRAGEQDRRGCIGRDPLEGIRIVHVDIREACKDHCEQEEHELLHGVQNSMR